MKSHLADVLDIYDGILKDAATRWPTSTRDTELDRIRLRRAAETRGLPFFTLVLPAVGKILDQALSSGNLPDEGYPLGYNLRHKKPELFRGFFGMVFDESGVLRDDADTEAVAILRQLLYLCKKYRAQCHSLAIKETLDEYFDIESHLPLPHEQTWFADEPTWETRTGHPIRSPAPVNPHNQDDLFPDNGSDGVVLPWDSLRAHARWTISGLGTPSWWDLKPKHGPGVVSEQLEVVNKYDFLYWPRKLGRWFAFDWFGTGCFYSDADPSDREPPSRLIAVPKTVKGPRLIAAEPSAHQWMQQGILGWIRDRLPDTALRDTIRLDDQERSREWALRASIDGSLCTIDLSSASDRLSCRLVEYIFQGSELLDGMHACRTRMLVQTISKDHPRMIRLKKFAPMGSALTFPIQSIVYSILSVWALRLAEGREQTLEGLGEDFRRVRVYGDDIIAPNHAYDTIKLVLHECGLKVNDAKSFRNGLFRESCGMDAFRGVDVTPAYHLESYDGSATSMAAVIECSNNLFKRQWWNASSVVANFLPHKEKKLLPVVGGEVSGLGFFSYCGSMYSHLKKVWNRGLQREEYLALGLSSKVTKTRGTGQASLTQYFTEEPDPELPWSSGQVGRVRVRKARTRVSGNS